VIFGKLTVLNSLKLKLHLFDLLYNKSYSKSTTNPLQIQNFSTKPLQIHNISTCQDVVDLLWSRQYIHYKSNQWSKAFDLSTTSRKAVQQVKKLYNSSTANPQLYDKSYNMLYSKSTANPQQIEQVEFELN
jgi:hypothetical protein